MKLRLAVLISLLSLVAVAALFAPPRNAGEAAVSGISYEEGCSTNGASIYILWRGIDPSATQVWLDLGGDIYWQPGNYAHAGPFKASTTAYNWDGLTGSSGYYVRINQQLPSGRWDPSETYYLPTEACSSKGN